MKTDTPMNAYIIKGLVHGHGGEPVLSLPELVIPRGGVTAILGSNGAGKSTLLTLLALLARPDRGRIDVLGEAVTRGNHRRLRDRVSLLLQQPYLLHTTVAHNVGWGINGGASGGERRARIARALAQVGLEGFEHKRVKRLSGGEAQRVALARLLARDPEVVLLDEPTTHLDHDARPLIEAALREWVEDRGATLIIATHDRAQAKRLGARIIHLDHGSPRNPAAR